MNRILFALSISVALAACNGNGQSPMSPMPPEQAPPLTPADAARTQAAPPTTSPCAFCFTEYAIPTSSSGASDIATGPDGNLWFTETSADKIGRITIRGTVTEYRGTLASPFGIKAGPAGDLWFAESGYIGRVTTSGLIANSFDPAWGCAGVAGCEDGYGGITVGPDGNLWVWHWAHSNPRPPRPGCHQFCPPRLPFTSTWFDVLNPGGGVVAQKDTVGSPGSDSLGGVVTSAGNLWYIDCSTLCHVKGHASIHEFTTSGLRSYSVPSLSRSPAGDLTAGPDGNVWFTENLANKIGKITPAGVITEYAVPTAASGPLGITAGPDGNVWFTENLANKIGRITPSGEFSQFSITTANAGPAGITKGSDGKLWFVESSANRIAKFVPSLQPRPFGQTREAESQDSAIHPRSRTLQQSRDLETMRLPRP